MLCNRLRVANEQIKALATQDVEGRVARQMLAFAQLYGRPTREGEVQIPLRLTQGDLAGLIGATRERVNQVIACYKQRRYISVDQNYRITIHKPEALSRRCGAPLQNLRFKRH
jgi:CRP/FNR family cyclic AMP-dependent transcriptional regulator